MGRWIWRGENLHLSLLHFSVCLVPAFFLLLKCLLPFAKAKDFTGDRAKLLVAYRKKCPVFCKRSVLADRGASSG